MSDSGSSSFSNRWIVGGIIVGLGLGIAITYYNFKNRGPLLLENFKLDEEVQKILTTQKHVDVSSLFKSDVDDDQLYIIETAPSIEKKRSYSSPPFPSISHENLGKETERKIKFWKCIASQSRNVKLGKSRIEDSEVKRLVDILMENKDLRELDVSENDISDASAQMLTDLFKIKKVETIDLSDNQLGDQAFISLGESIQSVKNLDLSRNGKVQLSGLQSLFKSLSNGNNSLENLTLNSLGIDQQAAEYLCEALKNCKKIQSLSLSFNNLGPGGIKSLTSGLEVCNITNLDLSFNNIQDEGVQHLSTVLKTCSLYSINLSTNSIGELGITSLGESLQRNKNLTELDLSFNPLGNSGVQSFVKFFASSSLSSLILSNIQIDNLGVKKISAFVSVSSKITLLNLSENEISDEGASSIAQSLTINTSLEELYLGTNQITEKGAKKLCSSSKLILLDLQDNPIQNKSEELFKNLVVKGILYI